MIIIKGRIPSKKNSRQTIYNKGRCLSIPSKRYNEWHEDASWQLKEQKVKFYENAVAMRIVFFAPDNRNADLTNKAESVMDMLVDNGIIKDDNWFVIKSIGLIFAGIDKDNPRVEIEIL